jgi:hypothetical protein
MKVVVETGTKQKPCLKVFFHNVKINQSFYIFILVEIEIKLFELYFQSNLVMNSLECPESNSLSHHLTKSFPVYQNKH